MMKRNFLIASLTSALFVFAACNHEPNNHEPNTPLTMAAANGDSAKVRELIAQKADVNARDQNGITPLMWAARSGQTEVIPALIDAGADVNARDCAVNGWTPLIHAIHKNQNTAALLLIERGADVNARGDDCPERKIESGPTPLMYAAGYDNTEIVRALLAKGANPYGMHGSNSVLSNAVAGAWDIDRPTANKCPTETVKALLEKAPDLNMQGDFWDQTALFFARQKGCTEIIGMLEKRRSVLAANQGGSRLGSHYVKVTPACWTHESSSSNDGVHQFNCGQTKVVIDHEKLLVNGQNYGALQKGDEVEVLHGKVLVNDKEAPLARTVASK